MMWKAFISFNDSCLLFRSSIELLIPRLSPWVSCTEDLILCRTSGQTVTIYSFPLRFFLPREASFPVFRYLQVSLQSLATLRFCIRLLGVWERLKHSFSCLIYYFSVSECRMKYSPLVWHITSRCLDIRWNTPSRACDITSWWLEIFAVVAS